jgi:4-alpha-glucanotransferase
MGVYTEYTDGLGQPVTVAPETLVTVCASLGASVSRPRDASAALRAFEAEKRTEAIPPVLVAWDGTLPDVSIPSRGAFHAELVLEGGDLFPLDIRGRTEGSVRLQFPTPLPCGYHRLTVEMSGAILTSTVISTPEQAWRRPGSHRSWGVGGQLAAFRSSRSRAFGDVRDLETVCRWVGERGGDLVMVLPLLPTFNSEPVEPSPYSSVSRLFWSELILNLGDAHRPVSVPTALDVRPADAEVRAALSGLRAPDASLLDDELVRYARFRGAQVRLGRDWRSWPARARSGELEPKYIDGEEERFHLVAQVLARRQLGDLRTDLERDGLRLGLDLAVGVHWDVGRRSARWRLPERSELGLPPGPSRGLAARGSPVFRGVHRPPGGSLGRSPG